MFVTGGGKHQHRKNSKRTSGIGFGLRGHKTGILQRLYKRKGGKGESTGNKEVGA